jgi:superfamily II DNA or RNA helicase
MDELTRQGVLVPMRILSCTTPDMTGAAMAGGEWTSKAASECETQIIGDVVMEWHKHANGKKTIAFGADIAYCQELAKRFKENGVRAECFTSETHALEREMLLEEFEGPDCKIRILISVEALAKGFDVQDIECVIDARPLRKSLSTAIQMWGRGLRSSLQTGKTECLLLDHSNNIRRFYDDFTDIYFNGFRTLDDGEKMDSVARKELDYEPTGCPRCHTTPFRRKCLKCGHEKVTQSMETEAAGEMEEIRIGKNVVASDRHELWQQLCGYAKGAKNPQGRASHLYRAFVGEWPPRQWHIDFTEPAPITKGTLNKIRSLNIAFHKAKEQSPTSML